jgi:putative sterol carrier protein
MAEQGSNEESETIAQVPCGDYPVPALAGVHGTIMFEGPRGFIHMAIEDGKVTLSHTAGRTDLVLRTRFPGELLRVVRGDANAITAVLRGRVEAEGDLMLLMKVAGSIPAITQQATAASATSGAE